MKTSIDKQIEGLKSDIEKIKIRNKKVELNKKWETSLSRKFLLILFTYLSIAFYFVAIDIERPWLNAVVPAFAFLLSTLSLPFFRKIWIKYKKNF